MILGASYTLRTSQDTAANATIKSLGLTEIYEKNKISHYFVKSHVTEDELVNIRLLLFPLEAVQDFQQIGHFSFIFFFF